MVGIFPSRRLAVTSFFVFLVLVLVVVVPNTAAAQSGQPVTDDEVNKLAREIYCPVCESTPLDVCPTQACADWREVIRTKLSQGETEQQIKDYFVAQYGPRAVAEPPREGFTLAIWIIPIVAVAIGGLIFAIYVQGLNTAASTPKVATQSSSTPVSEPTQDNYIARIERELQERAK